MGCSACRIHREIDGDVDNSTSVPGGVVPGPTLLVMVYDADIPFMDALENGLASFMHIPMLAAISVVVNAVYRVGWDRRPYHYYSQSNCVHD